MSLVFPTKILDQHLVVLGKTGAGKSSALRHIVEHLLKHNKRVCVIDPKGDWSGLKTSADGRGPGFAVIGFGEFKEPKATDVSINAQSGKQVAELIATGNRPCIIGFRGWPTSQMVRFWIDFAGTLFSTNSGELYLVGDEFHNFAPKGKIMDPEAGKCLHWSNRLMNEGRGLGLVCLIASQRPQKVHNDTLTACETLVAMRVIHKADRDAVKDWIDGCGDLEQGKEILDSLAGMARGEAFVWSPEIGFGPKRMTFPMFETFDSFAPPQLQKKVSDSGWASVNLDAVKAKLASVIEEQKANDPAELKRTIAGLRRELDQAKRSEPIKAETKEVLVFDDECREALKNVTSACEEVFAETVRRQKALYEIKEQIERLNRTVTNQGRFASAKNHEPRAIAHRPHNATPAPATSEISGGLRRMMIALAQRPGLNKKQLGLRAGLSSSSGTFGTYLGRLRSNGWVSGSDSMVLTDAGHSALGQYDPLPEGEDLLRFWLNELGGSGAGRMLTVLANAYPQEMTKEKIGEQAGISPTSGTFGTYLGKLRTLELVEGRGELRASKEFFQ